MTASEQFAPLSEAPSMKKLKVLFVCIGNSCRSPMAESIALRDFAGFFESSSAGLAPFGSVQKETIETLKRNGYPVESLSSKSIIEKEWAAAELVINMSGYPKQRVFPHGEWNKVEDWDVADPYGTDPRVYQRIFEDIRTRIESLSARLRNGRA